MEIKQLPIKAYLDQNLMPLLLEALAELAKEKPDEPIEFVAKFTGEKLLSVVFVKDKLLSPRKTEEAVFFAE